MADKYLWSGAAGAGTGADWTNAYTTETAANAGMAAGDRCFVADDHAETGTASLTLTSPGTSAAPCQFICALRSGGSVPPVAADLRATATVTNTTAVNMSLTGCASHNGVTFNNASGAVSGATTFNVCSTSGSSQNFENCTIKISNTSSSAKLNFGILNAGTQQKVRLLNSNIVLSTQSIVLLSVNLEWVCGSLTFTSTIPSTIFSSTASHIAEFRGVDFSTIGSGKTLFGAAPAISVVLLNRCKLNASVTVAATPTHPNARVDVIDCDSGATNYRNERYAYQGTLTTETSVVMSGGATDGVTPFSHKIATTANASFMLPFESFPMGEFYAGSTGSAISQTFELLTNNVTLTDRDAWVELEYMGSSATPLGSVFSTQANPLSAGTNLTSSSVTWLNAPGTPVKQKIVATWTPQMVGLYRAVLRVAKASTTVYLNPPAAKAA